MEDALKYLKYDWKEKKWCEIESTALHIIEESVPLLPSSLHGGLKTLKTIYILRRKENLELSKEYKNKSINLNGLTNI